MIKSRCNLAVNSSDLFTLSNKLGEYIGCNPMQLRKAFSDAAGLDKPIASDLCDGVRIHLNSWSGKRYTILLVSEKESVDLKAFEFDGKIPSRVH